MNTAATNKTFFRTFLTIGIAISLAAIYQTEIQTEAFLKIRTRYKWAILMVVFALNAAVALLIVLRADRMEKTWENLGLRHVDSAFYRIGGVLLSLLPLPFLWFARAVYFGSGLEAFFRLLWLFWWLVLVQAAGIKLMSRATWPIALAVVLLCDGVVAEVYTLVLPISNYPFSMGWSEASRFYYGSLVFSQSIYGARAPLSVWHGTRYLMLAVPFLIKGLPIWAARLWQVVLWLAVTAATCWALIRRLRLSGWTAMAIFGGWFFLYLFQGAVYYHLQVCVIIILLGVSAKHPWRSLAAVVAASVWAGMSRLNWYPVPAMLATALYMLDEPVSGTSPTWRYFGAPVVWAVSGMAAALLGQAFYILISGNTNLEAFGSSLTSALLWYRWLPSPTNPIGIIPGVLLVSVPVWLIVYWRYRQPARSMHALRWLVLGGMLPILFLGGLIVSTKIGGGGDLHNMDAYLVLLAIVAGYLLSGREVAEADLALPPAAVPWPMVALLLLIPVAFAILRIGSPFLYDKAKADADLSAVGLAVQNYSQSGEILFMYERQLLTFGMIPRVPLVQEDEVVSLMEMAISGNEPYLTQFYSDLASHRFAAIVAHPQNLGVETGDFIEESDVWNRLVAQPMLCQYKPALTLPYSHVQILVPRARPCVEFPPPIHGP